MSKLNELKELLSLLSDNATTTDSSKSEAANHLPVGKYVLCRCYYAGVIIGKLDWTDGEKFALSDCFRLWNWTCKKGKTLSSIANYGITKDKTVEHHSSDFLREVYEVIPVSEECLKSLEAYRND